jgi:uncharacterized protein (TIGR03067 family)
MHPPSQEFHLVLTLLFVLLLVTSDNSTDKPTAAQVDQAHQLLNGEWEIVSYIDDGEALGMRLVKAKLAKDGRVKIGARSFQVVNPDTNEARSTPFRINPLKQPKQLEFTSRDDRQVGGIYKFDGDDLVVCLESFPDTGYPAAFDAPAGSNRTLIRLRMVDHEAKIEPQTSPPITTNAPKPSVNNPPPTPAEHAAVATFASSRKPSNSEILKVRELFAGNWDITSIVDDGEKLGTELIRRRFAENGRIRFGTRSFSIVNPRTEERRVNAYRLDPTKSPSEIDVTTQMDSVLKGIYTFEGDRLTICVAKNDDDERPSSFDAPGGSDRLLVNMQLAKDDPPSFGNDGSYRSEPRPKPVPVAAPAVAAPPSPEEQARLADATVRRMVVGAWSLTDAWGSQTTVFQPDGSFVSTRTWARGRRRLFGPPSDTSNGSWSYQNGLLGAWVTSTTDPRVAGHRFDAHVRTIGEDTMVVTDAYGSIKTYRRLR